MPQLRLIPAGRRDGDHADLSDSGRLARILRALEKHADVVILDSSAVLSSSDAIVLASLADQVLLVGDFARTGRETRTAVVQTDGDAAHVRQVRTGRGSTGGDRHEPVLRLVVELLDERARSVGTTDDQHALQPDAPAAHPAVQHSGPRCRRFGLPGPSPCQPQMPPPCPGSMHAHKAAWLVIVGLIR